MIDLYFFRVVKASESSTCENLFEVELLADVSNINYAIRLFNFSAVSYRCHVCGVVVESSVTLSNDKWHFLLWNKNTNSPITFNCNLLLNQLLNKRFKQGIVE